jgi:hypothetical protein
MYSHTKAHDNINQFAIALGYDLGKWVFEVRPKGQLLNY